MVKRRQSKRVCQGYLEFLRCHQVAFPISADFDWLAQENWAVTLLWIWLLSESNRSEFAGLEDANARLNDVLLFAKRSSPSDASVWDQVCQLWGSLEHQQEVFLAWCSASIAELVDAGELPQTPFDQVDVWEWILTLVSPVKRKAHRYYATPVCVVDRMITMVGRQVSEVGKTLWGNDPEDWPVILDPAAGSGIFPRRLLSRFVGQPVLPSAVDSAERVRLVDAWLEKLVAIEREPLAGLVGNFLFYLQLHRTQLPLPRMKPWSVRIADALEPASTKDVVDVVLGNPPYAALTDPANRWMEQLLGGQIDGVDYRPQFASGTTAKKHWLHDDYIKFIRLGHYLIDRRGTGILCLVTNRSFLDSRGFENLRRQLQASFAGCQFLDLQPTARLQGSLNKAGRLFEIGSGVAIGCWTKPREVYAGTSGFFYGALQGTLEAKQQQLLECQLRWYPESKSPYNWTPKLIDDQVEEDYRMGTSVDSLLIESWSAIVTARDRVVIDPDRSVLRQRLRRLADPSVSTDELRESLFRRTRSDRYQQGDTRGWKLETARQQLRADDWEEKLTPCLYRPLDVQWMYYSTDWVDWHRQQDVAGLLQPGNVGLVVRRASPEGQAYRFFAVSRLPVVDGVLRSDNRGNETIFNLYRRNGQCNIPAKLMQDLAYQYDKPHLLLECSDTDYWDGGDRLAEQWRAGVLRPEMVLAWVYGQLQHPVYQQRYQHCLPFGLPRIVLPRCAKEAEVALQWGARRISLELRLQASPETWPATANVPWFGASCEVQRRNIQYLEESQRVMINTDSGCAGILPVEWEFLQGTHRVLERFLKTRANRVLSETDLQTWARILATIRMIQAWEVEVHRHSRLENGWPVIRQSTPWSDPSGV